MTKNTYANFRILAHLIRSSPLPFFVTAWITGQAAGAYFSSSFGCAVLFVGGCLLFCSRANILTMFFAPLVFGITSNLRLGQDLSSISNNNFRVLGQVTGKVRAPTPGKILLPIEVLGDTGSNFEIQLVGETMLCAGKDLPWRNASLLRDGDIVWLRGSTKPLTESGDPAGYTAYLQRRGFHHECRLSYVSGTVMTRNSFWMRMRGKTEENFESIAGEGELSGVLKAMLLGSNDTLSHELVTSLSRVGLSHVLVVSGYQVTLWHTWIWYLLAFLVPGRWNRARNIARLGGVTGVWGYVLLIGAEPSCLRAAVAVTICEFSRMGEARVSGVHSIALALLAVTVIWPGCFFEMGTQLTFAALLTIHLVSSCLRGRLPVLLEGVVTSLVTTLMTSVVLVCWAREIHPIGVLLNPIVVPISSLLGGPLALVGYLAWITGLDGNGILIREIAERLLLILYWAGSVGGEDSFLLTGENVVGRWIAMCLLAAVFSGVARYLFRTFKITYGTKIFRVRT